MNDILALAEIGLAFALASAVGYEIALWIRRRLILRAADRIATAYSTEQALARASLFLRQKLESYRRARLGAGVGGLKSMHAAATELVDEYRLFKLTRR
jgi:hypothetical protein